MPSAKPARPTSSPSVPLLFPHPEVETRSHRWLDQLTSGAIASIRGIAQAEGIDGGGVSRFLPLAFLAPGIVEALMNGRQGVELTAEKMRQILPIPCSWREQRHQLNL